MPITLLNLRYAAISDEDSEKLFLKCPTDLKSTLNLPRTDFPMKASLPKAEPVQLEQWEAQGLYDANSEGARGRADLRFA